MIKNGGFSIRIKIAVIVGDCPLAGSDRETSRPSLFDYRLTRSLPDDEVRKILRGFAAL